MIYECISHLEVISERRGARLRNREENLGSREIISFVYTALRMQGSFCAEGSPFPSHELKNNKTSLRKRAHFLKNQKKKIDDAFV